MESPDLYLLRQMPWDLYATLTLDGVNVKKPLGVLSYLVEQWHEIIGRKVYKLPNREPIVYYASPEEGDRHGRLHFHSCIAGLRGKDRWNQNLLHWSEGLWKLGIAEVRSYQPNLDGIGYIYNCWHAGANKFETGKICDRPGEAIVSKSYYPMLARVRGVDTQTEFRWRAETPVILRAAVICDTLKHPYNTVKRSGAPLSAQRG